MSFWYQPSLFNFYPPFMENYSGISTWNVIPLLPTPFPADLSQTQNKMESCQDASKVKNQVQIQANLMETNKTYRLKKKIKPEKKQKKKYERNRNLNSTILKQFVKDIQKNPQIVFQVQKLMNSSYLVTSFTSKLKEIFPQKMTYIRPICMRRLCLSKEDQEFSKMLKRVLFLYLKNEYPLLTFMRKKKKYSHLRQCRVLYDKVFNDV